MLKVLKDFWTRNVVVSRGLEIPILSPIDYFRGTVNAVLTKQDVENWYAISTNPKSLVKTLRWKIVDSYDSELQYSVITEREFLIDSLKKNILWAIQDFWFIPKNFIDDYNYLLDSQNLSNDEIKEACHEFFYIEVLRIIDNLTKKDVFMWKEWVIFRTKDYEHVLLDEEKQLLSYMLSSSLLSEVETFKLTLIIWNWWEFIGNFIKKYANNSFLENYIYRIKKSKRNKLSDELHKDTHLMIF